MVRPRMSWRMGAAAVGVLAALAIAATGCASETSGEGEAAKPKPVEEQPAPKSVEKQLREEQKAKPGESAQQIEEMLTAEMVVDVTWADPKMKRQFCNAYRYLGEAGFPAFKSLFGKATYGVTAREVFDEMASRC